MEPTRTRIFTLRPPWRWLAPAAAVGLGLALAVLFFWIFLILAAVGLVAGPIIAWRRRRSLRRGSAPRDSRDPRDPRDPGDPGDPGDPRDPRVIDVDYRIH
jgi:hypothetical protein